MQSRGSRFAPPALVLGAGFFFAALAGWQTGCDRPEHAGVEVAQTDCRVCHETEFQATTSPPHMEAFGSLADPRDCALCHVTAAWTPVAHTWFPLENAHDGPTCTACHTAGYAPGQTPSECVGCHRADYDAQVALGGHAFSENCQNCHTTVAWLPATLTHPENLFPTSGAHAFACADCHDESLGSYVGGQNTNCVGCHTGQHALAQMDAKHWEVGNYPRPSDTQPPNFCLSCHWDGRNHD